MSVHRVTKPRLGIGTPRIDSTWPLGRVRSALWGWKARTAAMRSATRRSTSAGLRAPPLYSPRWTLKRTNSSKGVPTRTSDSGKSSRRSMALFQVTSLGVASNTAMAWSRRSKPASSRS
jgi:hypothetical protein